MYAADRSPEHRELRYEASSAGASYRSHGTMTVEATASQETFLRGLLLLLRAAQDQWPHQTQLLSMAAAS